MGALTDDVILSRWCISSRRSCLVSLVSKVWWDTLLNSSTLVVAKVVALDLCTPLSSLDDEKALPWPTRGDLLPLVGPAAPPLLVLTQAPSLAFRPSFTSRSRSGKDRFLTNSADSVRVGIRSLVAAPRTMSKSRASAGPHAPNSLLMLDDDDEAFCCCCCCVRKDCRFCPDTFELPTSLSTPVSASNPPTAAEAMLLRPPPALFLVIGFSGRTVADAKVSVMGIESASSSPPPALRPPFCADVERLIVETRRKGRGATAGASD